VLLIYGVHVEAFLLFYIDQFGPCLNKPFGNYLMASKADQFTIKLHS